MSVALLDKRFRGELLAYFRQKVGNAADAEDLVQETFARLAKPGRLESIEDVRAYVYRTAANLVRERARLVATRISLRGVPLDDSLTDEGVFTPERILEGRDRVERVMLALRELPERTRTIFVLQRFEGFTYQQVARKLGLSESAIEKNMSRAVAHIGKWLSDGC